MANLLYFSYGANMDNNKLINRGIKVNWAMRAVLPGYKLVFNKKSKYNAQQGFANIEKCPSSSVEGVVYSVDDYGYIDDCEGYPKQYIKEIVWVTLGQKDHRQAIVYVAQGTMLAENLKPTKGYLYHLIEGAKQHDLSEKYIEELEKLRDKPDESQN